MPSQQYVGTEGGVYLGANKVADLDSWDFTIDRDMLERTSYGDDWKRQKPGLKAWTGSASGRWNMGDTTGQKVFEDSIIGASPLVTITFKITSTLSYTGDCYISSLNPSSGVADLVTVSFSITGDGPLTPSAGA